MKSKPKLWTESSKKLIKELHKELVINNINWHVQKTNNKKRSAELIISALAQLANNGEHQDVEDLLLQAIKWLRDEIKDPGCPSH
tara:strand:- start:1116 stop:1370 length:255 start_codon:yes stop_codon:yes gene_type:complete